MSFAGAAVTAATGAHSALAPAADQAHAIGGLWNVMLWTCVGVYALVLAGLAWALLRRRRESDGTPQAMARHERAWQRGLVAWAVFTAVVVAALTAASFSTDRALLARDADALRVRVTAKQWWWQVEYLDPDPSKHFVTANELRLPLGRMTRIELVSGDVIHSLWIPSLDGKQDLIPGRKLELAITPRKAGRYRGECAEFCGLQHAHMAMDVVVAAPEAIAAWRTHQLAPAPRPGSAAARRGQQVFLRGSCALCHAIAGTSAASRSGPDLTHLAGRATLAAGTLPNDRAHLLAWLADPQAHKPGTNMPDPRLTPTEVADLADYLQELE